LGGKSRQSKLRSLISSVPSLPLHCRARMIPKQKQGAALGIDFPINMACFQLASHRSSK
jgi:hypothetical protein